MAVRDRVFDEVLLSVENISLSFGGVKALTGVSFDVREHEIRAIIGPNGAGKSSLLNVINGVYRPQQGRIKFRGETRTHMEPRHSAELGIARTFQSLALFKGMSVLDNILAGRNLKMRVNLFLQALRVGPALREEIVAILKSTKAMIPEEKWFSNLPTVGNVGAASIWVMLDEFLKSGRAKRGERVLLIVPESGRAMVGFMMLEVVL